MKDYFQGRHVEITDLNKEDRNILRPIVGWTLAGALIAAVLLYASKSLAQEIPVHVIEHHNGVKLQLLRGPCKDQTSNVVIASAPPKFQRGWKALTSQWRMKDGTWQSFNGCWRVVDASEAGTPDDVFLLVFSDGEVVQLLKGELLQKKSGA